MSGRPLEKAQDGAMSILGCVRVTDENGLLIVTDSKENEIARAPESVFRSVHAPTG